jgi:3-oxoacyl-[acyl-carrier protein] reductase
MLTNRYALVTGATSGIGEAICTYLAKEKCNIIIHYNSNEAKANSLKEKLIGEYNVKCMTIKCNLESEDDINNLFNEIKFVDILVNNAAIELTDEFVNKTKETFDKTLSVNLVAPFLLSKHYGKIMYDNKWGRIINISSNNALDKYDPITLEYDASKSALISLTHNLALEFSPYVSVNAVCPGWILSDKVKKLNDELNGMLESEESKKILKQRFGKCDEVANLVLFLALNDYINNEVIRIDGGVL